VTVPAGVTGRFATFQSDYAPNTYLDMQVYKDGEQFATSAGSNSDEAVTVTEPGTYDIYLLVFSLPGGVDAVDIKFHSFLLGSAASGNLTVSPASQAVTVGGNRSVTATWSGLTPGSKYLGGIEWTNGGAVLDRTLIQVQA
jgi:hypothetical protein